MWRISSMHGTPLTGGTDLRCLEAYWGTVLVRNNLLRVRERRILVTGTTSVPCKREAGPCWMPETCAKYGCDYDLDAAPHVAITLKGIA